MDFAGALIVLRMGPLPSSNQEHSPISPMTTAHIVLDADFTVSELDRRVFGAFVEHLGRCVYTGIFEPEHPTADKHGFRRDVLDLVRELGPTIMRYPGGNFLSGYNWEDGVGPAEQRPVRLDLAWLSTEPNRFGTNEFIEWCQAAGTEPMLGVNLGTRGPDEARQFLEYCNHAGGTYLSELRAKHGYPQPHGVKFWCLGNEMDGPWQICQKTATEYGRAAKETAKVMKLVDPSIQLAACGSSHRNMPTFGAWEYEVLEHTFDDVDFLSLHMYYENPLQDVLEFLGNIEIMDRFIKEAVAVSDAVAAKRRSAKRIMLSFDEWNVWYKARAARDMEPPDWPFAPRLIEEIYDLQDALVVGGALITLINNADRVKAACLAQLVNVIGAIHAEPGGPAWRQTIFHPFKLASQYGRGTVLRANVRSSRYSTKTAGDSTQVLAATVHDPVDRRIVLFLLNRSTDAPTDLSIEFRGFAPIQQGKILVLHGNELLATNSAAAPDRIKPIEHSELSLRADKIGAQLPPLSWNTLVLSY
jgi:Alpha-L-arabinofuranosidase